MTNIKKIKLTSSSTPVEIEDTTARTAAQAAVKDFKINGASKVDSNKVASLTIVDNLTSTSTDAALSANQGKALADRLTLAESVGRYLSTWNCETGLPTTNPVLPTGQTTYPYKTGDYYIILKVVSPLTSNLIPDGTAYTLDVPSTKHFETSTLVPTIKVGDRFVYSANETTGEWQVVPNVQPEEKVRDITVDGTSIVSNSTGIAALKTMVEGASDPGLMPTGILEKINQKQELIKDSTANRVVATNGNTRPEEETLKFLDIKDDIPSETSTDPFIASTTCVQNAISTLQTKLPAADGGKTQVAQLNELGSITKLDVVYEVPATISDTTLVTSGAIRSALNTMKASISDDGVLTLFG